METTALVRGNLSAERDKEKKETEQQEEEDVRDKKRELCCRIPTVLNRTA